jgi:hypothetical protein
MNHTPSYLISNGTDKPTKQVPVLWAWYCEMVERENEGEVYASGEALGQYVCDGIFVDEDGDEVREVDMSGADWLCFQNYGRDPFSKVQS